jgi:hypothetical protein
VSTRPAATALGLGCSTWVNPALFNCRGDRVERARLYKAGNERCFGVQIATNNIAEGVAAAKLAQEAGPLRPQRSLPTHSGHHAAKELDGVCMRLAVWWRTVLRCAMCCCAVRLETYKRQQILLLQLVAPCCRCFLAEPQLWLPNPW